MPERIREQELNQSRNAPLSRGLELAERELAEERIFLLNVSAIENFFNTHPRLQELQGSFLYDGSPLKEKPWGYAYAKELTSILRDDRFALLPFTTEADTLIEFSRIIHRKHPDRTRPELCPTLYEYQENRVALKSLKELIFSPGFLLAPSYADQCKLLEKFRRTDGTPYWIGQNPNVR